MTQWHLVFLEKKCLQVIYQLWSEHAGMLRWQREGLCLGYETEKTIIMVVQMLISQLSYNYSTFQTGHNAEITDGSNSGKYCFRLHHFTRKSCMCCYCQGQIISCNCPLTRERITSSPACLTNRMWGITSRSRRKCLHDHREHFVMAVDGDDGFKLKPHLWTKSWPCSCCTTSCPWCDITRSSLPVLAVTLSASRTVWTLRLPGSGLFPDLIQEKSPKVRNEKGKRTWEEQKQKAPFWFIEIKNNQREILCFFIYISRGDYQNGGFCFIHCHVTISQQLAAAYCLEGKGWKELNIVRNRGI